MRNTPEGRAFVRLAASEGVDGAVAERDGPFGDYSQGRPEDQPRKRSGAPRVRCIVNTASRAWETQK